MEKPADIRDVLTDVFAALERIAEALEEMNENVDAMTVELESDPIKGRRTAVRAYLMGD